MWSWSRLRCRLLHWSMASDWQQLGLFPYPSLGTGNVGVINKRTTQIWKISSVSCYTTCVCVCVWQASRRLWTCLCGNSLYFFNNAKDAHVRIRLSTFCCFCLCIPVCGNIVRVLQYVEKMDLSGFVSLKDDCSRDRNLEAARLILRMKDGETKLTVISINSTQEQTMFGGWRTSTWTPDPGFSIRTASFSGWCVYH